MTRRARDAPGSQDRKPNHLRRVGCGIVAIPTLARTRGFRDTPARMRDRRITAQPDSRHAATRRKQPFCIFLPIIRIFLIA